MDRQKTGSESQYPDPAPRSRTCFARRHMPPAVFAYYDYCSHVSHKSGVFYSHDRKDASEFGERGVSPVSVRRARHWLEQSGWITRMDQTRRTAAGTWAPIRYRVLTHDDWTKLNPGKCRRRAGFVSKPETHSVAGEEPQPETDSVPGPETDLIATGDSFDHQPATESVAKGCKDSKREKEVLESDAPCGASSTATPETGVTTTSFHLLKPKPLALKLNKAKRTILLREIRHPGINEVTRASFRKQLEEVEEEIGAQERARARRKGKSSS